MAIGVYFGVTGLNAERYEECIKRLKKAGKGHPPGRSFHSAFGPPDKLMVFDIWTSQSAFERFGKTLMPILQEVNAVAGDPDIVPIHKVITPPRAPANRVAGPRKKK